MEGVDDRREYAIKLYLDYSAFVTEAALYAICFPHIRSTVSVEVKDLADATVGIGVDSREAVPLSQVVARFLPQVQAVNDGPTQGLHDTAGRPMPPCIVMAKGDSLQDWSGRAKPDFFTTLGVREVGLIIRYRYTYDIKCDVCIVALCVSSGHCTRCVVRVVALCARLPPWRGPMLHTSWQSWFKKLHTNACLSRSHGC